MSADRRDSPVPVRVPSSQAATVMFLLILLAVVVAVLAYAWVGFPLLLELLAGCGRRRADEPSRGGQPLRLAVLFSVAERIHNVLGCECLDVKPTVLVGVDGATDGTAVSASAVAASHPNVHVHVFEENRGKVAVLKDLVRCAGSADILVFTDANTDFRPDALGKLRRHFSDPAVGGVCGRLVFLDHDGVETHENVYWRWENRLKMLESRLDSCLGANGAIYAIRRDLFPADLPDNTRIDDFVIGMKVREQGRRMLYDPEAVATEELPATVHDEWVRRVRIGSGAYQAIRLCRRCLLPRYGTFAWLFASHKILRWITPHLMLAGAALVLLLELGPFASNLFVHCVSTAYLLLLGCALLDRALPVLRRCRAAMPVRVAAYFVVIQAALFAGFVRFCRGDLKGTWRRTRR